MTKLRDDAVEAARHLSPQAQDEIARVLLRLAGTDAAAPVALSDDERAAISRSRAAATRGEFATDEQVLGVWARYGLKANRRIACAVLLSGQRPLAVEIDVASSACRRLGFV